MCCGSTLIYRCCGFKQVEYFFTCDDGLDPEYPLQHRILGRVKYTNKVCQKCRSARRSAEEEEARDREWQQSRAKCVMEYFQGIRSSPRTDDEVRIMRREEIEEAYRAGNRLHPFSLGDAADDWDIQHHREAIEFEEQNPENPVLQPGMFQMMLDIQRDIDETGQPLTDENRYFAFHRLSAAVNERVEPERTLNFGQWIAGIGDPVQDNISPETDLHRDLRRFEEYLHPPRPGFQYANVRLFEMARDSILTGDRERYEYTPLPFVPNITDGPRPLSFRQWLIANVNPAFVRCNPITGVFIRILRDYGEYLEANGFLEDLVIFRADRRDRVATFRRILEHVPERPTFGPAFIGGRDARASESCAERYGEMIEDIGNLLVEGGRRVRAEIVHHQRDDFTPCEDDCEWPNCYTSRNRNHRNSTPPWDLARFEAEDRNQIVIPSGDAGDGDEEDADVNDCITSQRSEQGDDPR